MQQNTITQNLLEKYIPFKTKFNTDQFHELEKWNSDFLRDTDNAKNEQRLLRIAIIGQIKRGKSSFLNSLLFEGKDVLPKAATPMTAALTKISYSEQPEASVEFYTADEWNLVCNKAKAVDQKEQDYQNQLAKFKQAKANSDHSAPRPQAPQLGDEERACQELVGMVRANNIDVQDYLDQSKRIEGVSSNDELVSKLNDYVGAHGRFTALVKSTELKLNIESLKDIEIVDTPGMNDPIISRSRRTQEFVGQCDVVFFLSYCSQFMDNQDMRLLAQNIPEKGIKNIILIGSAFDSVMLDEYHKYSDIKSLIVNTREKLSNQAHREVDNINQQASNAQSQSNLTAALTKSLPPVFISSRCYDLATKNMDQFSEEENHSFGQLNIMFSGVEFSKEDFLQLANFDIINKKLNELREQKEEILQGRLEAVTQGYQQTLVRVLGEMKQDISFKHEQLSKGDLATVTAQKDELVKQLQKGEIKVSTVFEKYRIQAEKSLLKMKNEIESDALRAKQVESHSSSRQESYQTSSQVSDSSWYNPLSWGSTKTVTQTHYRTVNYTYANVQEAVAKLENFTIETSKQLFKVSEEAISLPSFKTDIKQSIRELLDFESDNFDPEMVLLPLNNAVERINIPAISLDSDTYINRIQQEFTNHEVEGDEIAKLRSEQSRVVSMLLADIAKEVDKAITNILEKLQTEEQSFIPSLTHDLNHRVEELKIELDHKTQNLETYASILSDIHDDLATVQELNLSQ